MLFAIDIGNTNLTIGLYDEQKLIFLARLATDTRRTAEQYALELNQIAALDKKSMSSVTGAIISSVVPELTGVLKRAVFLLTGIIPSVLGPGLKSGLNIKI
ncbi:MAG: type III pantothenate kinase, partial [Clostridia bacterium]|nr:type III pantothenate kinase [Clostridia bacterium]